MSGDSWLLIVEAKQIYGKSETTMRSVVRKLKKSKSKDLKVISENGREKLLIKRAALDSIFSVSTDSIKGDRQTSANDSDLVEFLKGQIEIKDKQIDQLSHLLHQEKENVKMLMLQSGDIDASVNESAKEKPQDVAQDKSAVWVMLLIFAVIGALVWSVMRLL